MHEATEISQEQGSKYTISGRQAQGTGLRSTKADAPSQDDLIADCGQV